MMIVSSQHYIDDEIVEAKEAGFRWASKKKAWYWHRPEDAVKGSHKTTLEGIRQKYGSEVITAAKAHRLALQA